MHKTIIYENTPLRTEDATREVPSFALKMETKEKVTLERF